MKISDQSRFEVCPACKGSLEPCQYCLDIGFMTHEEAHEFHEKIEHDAEEARLAEAWREMTSA